MWGRMDGQPENITPVGTAVAGVETLISAALVTPYPEWQVWHGDKEEPVVRKGLEPADVGAPPAVTLLHIITRNRKSLFDAGVTL